jgi:hypothetical protein
MDSEFQSILALDELGSIMQQLRAASQNAIGTGSFWGRVTVNGTTIQYRAYTLPDGTINVGTYYVP